MKYKVLNVLICPECFKELNLKVFLQEEKEIIEGLLTCSGCNSNYPIIQGVPRLLPENLRKNLFLRYKEYFKKYQSYFFKKETDSLSGETKIKIKTQQSFGFQWIRFSKMYNEFKKHFLSFINPPVTPEFFSGKVGIDVGCGTGRHMYFASLWGAEIFGIDLSEAVDSAYSNLRNLPNAHIIQGDIYNLPIKNNYFDFVYCIGVLHHLPDPKKGFEKILSLAKDKNSSVFIWVYSKKKLNLLTHFLRLLTSWIPHHLLYILCFVIALIEWILILYPYHVLTKIPFLKILDKIVPTHFVTYSGYPFGMSHADWFDRLSAPLRHYFNEQDLKNWFREFGLKNILVTPTKNYGWRGYGEKK